MAYFANGSDTRLDAQCEDCLHEDPDAGCPIAFVALTFNYDQIGNENLRACMESLISEKEGCLMRPYVMALKEKPKPDKETMEIFRKNSGFMKSMGAAIQGKPVDNEFMKANLE